MSIHLVKRIRIDAHIEIYMKMDIFPMKNRHQMAYLTCFKPQHTRPSLIEISDVRSVDFSQIEMKCLEKTLLFIFQKTWT